MFTADVVVSNRRINVDRCYLRTQAALAWRRMRNRVWIRRISRSRIRISKHVRLMGSRGYIRVDTDYMQMGISSSLRPVRSCVCHP